MKSTRVENLLRWLGRAQFFTYSTILHIGLVALLSAVVIHRVNQKDDQGRFERIGEPDGGTDTVFVEPEKTESLPIIEEFPKKIDTLPPIKTTSGPTTEFLTEIATYGGNQQFVISPPSPEGPARKRIDLPITEGGSQNSPITSTPTSGIPMTKEMAGTLYDTMVKWLPPSGNGNPIGARRYEFQAHVAQYRGGDWNSAHEVRDGEITRGALVNLTWVMRDWTRDRVNSSVSVKPLNLAEGALLNEMPPFIFFTGSKDFVLDDDEIDNLRRYILSGGAIWGDSSLPGTNSRFDIAFRREMQRVVGDVSVNWETLPSDHKLFQMQFRQAGAPAGLNHYDEPVYVMRPIAGEISILYTANDYGNMMEIGLTEDGEIDTRRDSAHRYVAINDHVWHHRDIYFRNIDEDSLTATYEFGTNMVLYLLTRWEDEIRQFRP